MNATALSPSDAESPAKLMTAEEFVNTYENHGARTGGRPSRGVANVVPRTRIYM